MTGFNPLPNDRAVLSSIISGFGTVNSMAGEPGDGIPLFNTSMREVLATQAAQRDSEAVEAMKAKQAKLNALPITIVTERVNDDGYEYFRIVVKRGKDEILDEYHERNEREAKEAVRNMRMRWAETRTADSMRVVPEGTTLLDIRADRYIARRNDGRRSIDRRSVRPADDVVAEDGLVLDIEEDNTTTGSLNEIFDEVAVFEEEDLEIDQF